MPDVKPVAAHPPPQPKIKSMLREYWISVASLIGFLCFWEALCRFGIVGSYQLVPPSEVFSVFLEKFWDTSPDGATLQVHTLTSLGLALGAFAMAMLTGIPLGLFMGWYKPVRILARPIFDSMRPIPPIAWISLAILWLGIGYTAKVFIIWLSAFVPCVINAYIGITLANPVLIRVSNIYGASNWETFRKIGVPSAIPMIFTGLKLSLNAAWTTLVAAELLAASEGLGFLIQMGRRIARPDIIIVGMIAIGFSGALMSALLSYIESRFASSRSL
ncbi:MAG: ABC transporter permease [Deltaproteobacteria bacterium]|jgi:NitT/TauT family transport system permease protein|nr:ABC transporter permease [Deltaproteobacteria bacterium]